MTQQTIIEKLINYFLIKADLNIISETETQRLYNL